LYHQSRAGTPEIDRTPEPEDAHAPTVGLAMAVGVLPLAVISFVGGTDHGICSVITSAIKSGRVAGGARGSLDTSYRQTSVMKRGPSPGAGQDNGVWPRLLIRLTNAGGSLPP
jgi:hypothetical protein